MARSWRHRGAGFTLIELVVAMSISSMLMVAMGSIALITSHALPDKNDPSERLVTAIEAVEQIGRNLELAVSLSQTDPRIVRGYVPDRGHGDAGPESVSYEWSGVPGDPLVQRYNGGPDVTLCENVHDFSLEYTHFAKPLKHTPRVLMIVGDGANPDTQDLARKAQIESWGLGVDLIDPYAGDAAYVSALADVDVMYWSEQHGDSPPSWIFDAALGIVSEKRQTLSEIGISKLTNWQWYSVLQIVDNSHEITRVFPLGPIQIFSSDQYGIISTGTIAPDGKILGDNSGYDIMVAVEVDGTLHDGRTAAARRVSMPWGDKDFDFNSVTDDGLTIMHRAIIWAAAPVGVSAVKIKLQIGSDVSGRIETQVKLLNLPEAL